ncbi:MAG: nodulation protein NfeD [Gammaproteobacteria bacterium]|nr:nodulation protein NfeD [Gammaproteobacteria bacterium]
MTMLAIGSKTCRLSGAYFLVGLLLLAVSWIAAAPRFAAVLQVEGSIGPATEDYVVRGIDDAVSRNAELVILRIDTPGGLDQSMRAIIQKILAAPLPIVAYVAPSGARAASAGTYILYAAHVAAMAPATTLGAATPVELGGASSLLQIKDKPADGLLRDDTDSAKTRKMVNDAAAYIRGLAVSRGRNAEWAERAVREAVTLTASEALRKNVIEIVAADMPDLLRQLDGRRVNVAGIERTLSTDRLTSEVMAPDWRNRLLTIIANPNIAYILMLVGIYGLVFELASPGAVLPGVVGAVCLLLALYAFQVLPVNYTGVVLIVLGIVFMVAEAFAPSFGALGFGGVAAFVGGSVMLMDDASLAVSWQLIGGTALVAASFFLWIITRLLKTRNTRPVTGAEQMLGSFGVALEDFDDHGWVRVHSENWNARTHSRVLKGQKVRVLAMDGLTLTVEPLADNPPGD